METENKIKISVIVPVYNTEKYIAECLDSILGQTLKELEVYCVDDGSTDNSVAIIQQYMQKDSRVHLLKQEHKGGGAARNLGLEHAKGEYLSFIDADDYIDTSMYEKMYTKCVEADAEVIVCSVRFLYQATGAIRDTDAGLRVGNLPQKEVFSYKDMPETIFNTFHNWAWNKLFRRSFVIEKKIRFQEIFRTNDLFFTNQALLEAERIVALDEYLIYYRIDPEGTNCQSNNDEYLLDFAKAFIKLKEYLIERNLYELLKQSFLNHALDGCIANLNSLEFRKSQEKLYNLLKNEVFTQLDLYPKVEEEYFSEFNHMVGNVEKYEKIFTGEYVDYLIRYADVMKGQFTQLQYDIYHTDNRVIDLNRRIHELEQSEAELTKSNAELIRREEELHQNEERLYGEISGLNQRIEEVYQSRSYRYGHKLLALPRLILRVVDKCKN